MILLRIILKGFGGSAMPVATIASHDPDLSDFYVKHRTLLGAKTIGQ
jgi:hypothetical protein